MGGKKNKRSQGSTQFKNHVQNIRMPNINQMTKEELENFMDQKITIISQEENIILQTQDELKETQSFTIERKRQTNEDYENIKLTEKDQIEILKQFLAAKERKDYGNLGDQELINKLKVDYFRGEGSFRPENKNKNLTNKCIKIFGFMDESLNDDRDNCKDDLITILKNKSQMKIIERNSQSSSDFSQDDLDMDIGRVTLETVFKDSENGSKTMTLIRHKETKIIKRREEPETKQQQQQPQPKAPQPQLSDVFREIIRQQQVLLNLAHSSILFVDSSYQESKRQRWKEWFFIIYKDQNLNLQKKKDLKIQIELNRLKYTTFGNAQLLKQNSEFEKIFTDMLLLSPDVKLHQSNLKALSLELMNLRFEGTQIEKRSFIYGLITLTQQIRITLYYQIHKNIKKVEINSQIKNKLYYFQPETQQEHLALLRSLNLNDKIIQKQEEQKIANRKVKFIDKLYEMYEIYLAKINKIMKLGLYQRIFNKQQYQSSYQSQAQREHEENDKQFLLGFFFINVFNDPLIRYFQQTYVQEESAKQAKIQEEWGKFIDYHLTDWTYQMYELNIFDRISDITDWSKPLWFEILMRHIKQINEFDAPNNKLCDEMFGVKPYIKATQIQIKQIMGQESMDKQKQEKFASILHINEMLEWNEFKETIHSYICQECCSINLNRKYLNGELNECCRQIGFQAKYFNIKAEELAQQKVITKTITLDCHCKNARATLKASIISQNSQLLVNIEVLDSQKYSPPPEQFMYSAKTQKQVVRNCNEDQQQPVIAQKDTKSSQTLKSPPPEAKSSASTLPTPAPEETAQDVKTDTQQQKEKKKKKRNKKKNKKKAGETTVQFGASDLSPEQMTQNEENVFQIAADVDEEEEEDGGYDEAFENHLILFEKRLSEQAYQAQQKLKPNISEDWLNKIKNENTVSRNSDLVN